MDRAYINSSSSSELSDKGDFKRERWLNFTIDSGDLLPRLKKRGRIPCGLFREQGGQHNVAKWA
jgi:hypothetical protein